MKTTGRARLAACLAASCLAASCLAAGCRASPELAPDPGASDPGATQPAAAQGAPAGGGAAPTGGLPASLPAPAQSRVPDVLYVPTPEAVVARMLELARVGPNDLVYDLGCGDGRIVAAAAARHGARAVGFDIDPVRIAEARHTITRYGVERLVQLERRDIFTLDLRAASVVALYLLPELNVKLLPQLERMRPGSRVVSHDFDIAGVVPERVERLEVEGKPHSIYLFELPLKKEADPRVP